MPKTLNLHGERRLVLLSLFFLLALGWVYYFRPRPAFVHQFEVAYYDSYWNRIISPAKGATGVDVEPLVGLVTPLYVSTLIDTELWLTVTNTSKTQTICPTFVITSNTENALLARDGHSYELVNPQVMLRSEEARDATVTGGRNAIAFGPLQPQESANRLLWVRFLPLGGTKGEAISGTVNVEPAPPILTGEAISGTVNVEPAPPILTGEAISGTVHFAVHLLNPLNCDATTLSDDADALSLPGAKPATVSMGQTIARGFVRTLLLPPWSNGLIISLALLLAFLANAVVSLTEERTLERLKAQNKEAAGVSTILWHLFFWGVVVLFGAHLTIFAGDLLIRLGLDESYEVRYRYLYSTLIFLLLSTLALIPAYTNHDRSDGSYYYWVKRVIKPARRNLHDLVNLVLVLLALLPAIAWAGEAWYCRSAGCADPWHLLIYTIIAFVFWPLAWLIFGRPGLGGGNANAGNPNASAAGGNPINPVNPPAAPIAPAAGGVPAPATQPIVDNPAPQADPQALAIIQSRLAALGGRLDTLSARPLTQWSGRLPTERELQALRDEIKKLPDLDQGGLAEELDEVDARVKQARALVRPDRLLDRARDNAADFTRLVAAATDDAGVSSQQTLHYYGEWRKALDNKRDKHKFDLEPAASAFPKLLKAVDDAEVLFRRLYGMVPLPADNAEELAVAIGRLRAIRDDDQLGPTQTVRFLAHADADAGDFRVMPVTQAIDTARQRLRKHWLAQLRSANNEVTEIRVAGPAADAAGRAALQARLSKIETFINGLPAQLPGWSAVYNGAGGEDIDRELAENTEALRANFVATMGDLQTLTPSASPEMIP